MDRHTGKSECSGFTHLKPELPDMGCRPDSFKHHALCFQLYPQKYAAACDVDYFSGKMVFQDRVSWDMKQDVFRPDAHMLMCRVRRAMGNDFQGGACDLQAVPIQMIRHDVFHSHEMGGEPGIRFFKKRQDISLLEAHRCIIATLAWLGPPDWVGKTIKIIK